MNFPKNFQKLTFWPLQIYGWLMFSFVIYLKVITIYPFSNAALIYTFTLAVMGFVFTALNRAFYKKINTFEKSIISTILTAILFSFVVGISSASIVVAIIPRYINGFLIMGSFQTVMMNLTFVVLLWNTVYFMLKYFQLTIIEFQKRQIADFDKEIAKRNEQNALTIAETHAKELMAKTLILSKHNDTLDRIALELNKVDHFHDDMIRKIQSLIESAKHNQSDWEDFYFWFNKSNEGFFKALAAKFPELSVQEQKVCAYIKLNLPSKEISALTHLHVKSVEQYRFRIRQKLNLNKAQNLQEFLNQL